MMRRRGEREINIFNIAFLDVITGALGAFVLLVILLSASLRKQSDADPAELLRLRAAVARLTTLNTQLTSQNQILTSQNQALAGQNQALTGQNQTLTDQNTGLKQDVSRLSRQHPVTVITRWTCPDGHMRAYLASSGTATDQSSMPAFNPALPAQDRFWTGTAHYAQLSKTLSRDIALFAADIWMDGLSANHGKSKLFYVLQPPLAPPSPCTVYSLVATEKNLDVVGPIQLDGTRPWALAAILNVDDDGVAAVTTPTAADLSDAERSNINAWLASTAGQRH